MSADGEVCDEVETAMSAPDALDYPIQQAGEEALRLFRRLLSMENSELYSKNVLSMNVVKLEAEKYKLWTINLGVFASGHASLDYRLRDAENMRGAVLKFLEDLCTPLTEIITLAKTLDNPVDGESDFPSADENTLEIEFSDDSQSEDSEQDPFGTKYIVGSIRNPINMLFRLSTTIRNPSSRIVPMKTPNKDDALYLKGIKHFDAVHVRSIFRHYEVLREREERVAGNESCMELEAAASETPAMHDEEGYVVDPGQENPLVQRLAHAITRRRQQLLYWRRHHEKRSRTVEAVSETEATKEPAIDDVPLPVFDNERPPTITPSQQLDQAHTPTIPSLTTATEFYDQETPIDFNLESQTVRSETTMSQYSSWKGSPEALDFPLAPDIDPDDEYILCPFCYFILPSKAAGQKQWKAHLIHDLRPYVCTYENCKSAHVLFDSKMEWINHENLMHRTVPKDELQADLRSEDFDNQHHVNATVISTPERNCPICEAWIDNLPDYHEHVAAHLERLSLFALPKDEKRNDSEDDGSSNGLGSRRGNFSSLSSFNFRDTPKADAYEGSLSLESIDETELQPEDSRSLSPIPSIADQSLFSEDEEEHAEQDVQTELRPKDSRSLPASPSLTDRSLAPGDEEEHIEQDVHLHDNEISENESITRDNSKVVDDKLDMSGRHDEMNFVISDQMTLHPSQILSNLRSWFPEDGQEDSRELLSSTPSAIVSVGLCFLVAASDGAQALMQDTNDELPRDLRTNIEHCYEDCLRAFRVAEDNMRRVSLAMNEIKETGGAMENIRDSLHQIADIAKSPAPQKDDRMLKEEIELLGKLLAKLLNDAKLCSKNTADVYKSFDIWYTRATSVHQAFTEAHAKISDTNNKKNVQKGVIKRTFVRAHSFISGEPVQTEEDREAVHKSQEELAKILCDGSSPADVLTILKFCLDRLVRMKIILDELTTFFKTLHTDIGNIVEYDIPFLETFCRSANVLANNKKRMTNFHLRLIKMHIRAILAHAKAASYIAISRKSIQPGVTLLADIRIQLSYPVGQLIAKLYRYGEEKGNKVEKFLSDQREHGVIVHFRALSGGLPKELENFRIS